MERKEVIARIKEILIRSTDFHNVYTPLELCDEMLEKIPELNNEINILVMFNLEFLWVIREKIGNLKNVWFLTPDDLKEKAALGMGVNQNKILRYEYNTKDIKEREKMPKFDVVVGNPPFKGNLYVKFLNIAYDISKRYIIFIHPGTIYFNEKDNKKQKEEIKYKEKIKTHLNEIWMFNSNMYFSSIALWVPMVITFIDKFKKDESVILDDKINKIKYKYDKLSNINKYGNIKEYFSLKKIILNSCETDNLQNHANWIFSKNKIISNYYVNLAQLRGHSYTDKTKLVDDDFYTFLPKDRSVEKKVTNQLYFCFNDKISANNFLNYLKTNFARFSLSLYKINMQLNRGELKSVPWLDFSKEWTDEKLYEYFCLTKEEIEFIEKNIPKYY